MALNQQVALTPLMTLRRLRAILSLRAKPHRPFGGTARYMLILMLLWPASPWARDFEVSVLPFQVSGSVPEAYFSTSSLPTDIQKAAAFLFELHKNYPLQSTADLNRQLPATTLQNGPSAGIDYCSYIRGSHILKGEASFAGTSGVRFAIKLISCNTGRVVNQGSSSGPLNEFQSLLASAIKGSTVSFRDQTLPSWPDQESEWIVVMDQSGSMAGPKKELVKALKALSAEATGSLGLGLLLVSENGHRLIPAQRNLKEVISILEGSATGGEVDLGQIARSFQELKKLPTRNRKVIIYTDAAGGSSASFESAIRSLAASGSSPLLFNPPSLPASGRMLFARLNRTLKLESPELMYGMRAGFVEGFSLFFVQKSDRFYVARKDVSAALQTGRLSADTLEPVATVNLRDEALTLDSVIRSYAKQRNIRLIGTGDLVSNLSVRLNSLNQGDAAGKYRFLVKNGSSAFWISSNDPSVARRLTGYKNKNETVYLGLQLRPGGLAPENNPSLVLIRSAGEVPSLFIQKYNHIQSEKLLKKQDIWFFLVEVVDSR